MYEVPQQDRHHGADSRSSDWRHKTKIMYRAFLSYAQLKEYIEILITNDLLEMQSGGDIFKTTPKGSRFLQIYNNIGDFITIHPDAGRRIAQ